MVARVLLWFAWWTGCGVLVYLAGNAFLGRNEPLWAGAALGFSLGLAMVLLEHASRRGWIRGIWRDPERVQRLKKRREALERQRMEIIAQARKAQGS